MILPLGERFNQSQTIPAVYTLPSFLKVTPTENFIGNFTEAKIVIYK
jgi:hypothetical protein